MIHGLNSRVFTPHGAKARGLLITHRGQRCGVWQFGARLHRALVAASGIDWDYAECANLRDFQTAAAASKPDVVLVNSHPSTMPWASKGLRYEGAVTFAVFHEASQASVSALKDRPFDVFLCPDPTLLPYDPGALSVPRFMPSPLLDLPPAPEVFTVGSFGFGTPGKGFEKLCALVNAQFIEARIRINIPPHDSSAIVSAVQVAQIVDACRAAVTRPGIILEITHDFFDEAGLLNFLAANTLNAFLYEDAPGRGISSCTDYALAAGRPIAVTRTSMFRHLTGVNPSICVEDRLLAAIAATGASPLQRYCSGYTEAAAGATWNATILDALATRLAARAVPDGRGFNKLLDDRARAAYAGPLEDLHRLAPEMLGRKIERANIQQAFALDAARRLALRFDAPRILVVGSYEDTTCASLRALGYQLEEVDPQVNGLDLEAFYRARTAGAAFELILCVSVLEHVVDDEAFVRQAAALLAPGGIAIFTVDFSERYPETGQRPAADQRLYTQYDLRTRLMGVLPDCALIDPPSWSDGAEDFEYEDCQYAFATWVFKRLPPALARHAELIDRRLGGAPWKALMAGDRASHAAEVTALKSRHRDDLRAAQEELATDRTTHERELSVVRASHERELFVLRAAHSAEVTALSGRLACTDSFIEYVTQRNRIERMFFRLDGRPVKPLRRLLFHTSGKPRHLFSRVILHKDGTPRKAFARWMQNQIGLARTSVQRAAPLTVPRDGVSAEVIRDLEFRLAPQPPSATRRFARGIEKKLIRPIISPIPNRLRSFLVGGLSDQIRQLDERMEKQSSSRREVTAETRHNFSEMRDNFSEMRHYFSKMRDNFAEMHHDVLSEVHLLTVEAEKTLLTLAMERGPDAWLAAAPAPAEQAPKPVRVPLILPGGRIAEVECASADLSLGPSLINARGDSEPHVRSFLQTVVRPDWVCLDIGANLGAHTLSLAVLAHEGKVVAFEADPANYALLIRNAAALAAPKGRIDTVHIAIWDSVGTLVIGGADELAGCSFVADGAADAAKTKQRLRAVVDPSAISGTAVHLRLSDIAAVPLDDWVAANPLPRLDVIKLDVGGAEARVVRGADRVIREYHPIMVVEYNPACAEAYFAQPADALFHELEPRFDSIHALENDGSLSRLSGWRALRDRLKTGKGWEDLVCLPEPRGGARALQPRT